MKQTQQNLAEQLHITSWEIERRKSLLDFCDTDVDLLVSAKQCITQELSAIVDEFYTDQVSKPEIERLIGDEETLKRLKHYLSNYILDMFNGNYDDIYVLSRLRVGMVHNRIGVQPKLYISAIQTLQNILRVRLCATTTSEDENNRRQHTAAALDKIIMFDMTLVVDTYIHALVQQLHDNMDSIENYAKELETEVSNRTRELAEAAQRDPLTKLRNTRAFYEELRREIARCIRHDQPLTLAYIDMDNFKTVNDSFGHQEGDHILQSFAEALGKELRAEDLPARIGGDEFCIILSNTDMEASHEAVRRIMQAFDALKGNREVTLSVGLAALHLDLPQSSEQLIRQADQAMYQAKEIKGHAIVDA